MHQFKKKLAVNNINGGTQKTSLEFHSKVFKKFFCNNFNFVLAKY